MRISFGLLCFCFLLIFPDRLFGQAEPVPAELGQPRISVQKYSLELSMSNPRITCLLLHSEGYVWVGTQNGLNRFDGYDFAPLDKQPGSKTQFSGKILKGLHEIEGGNIIIQFSHDEVNDTANLLNPKTLELKALPIPPGKNLFSTNEKGELFLLSKGLDGLTAIYKLQPDLTFQKLVELGKGFLPYRFRVGKSGGKTFFLIGDWLKGILKIEVGATGAKLDTVVASSNFDLTAELKTRLDFLMKHPERFDVTEHELFFWEIGGDDHISLAFNDELVKCRIADGAVLSRRKLPLRWQSSGMSIDRQGNLLIHGRAGIDQSRRGFLLLHKTGGYAEIPFSLVGDGINLITAAGQNFYDYFWVGSFDGLHRITIHPSNIKRLLYQPSQSGSFGIQVRGIQQDGEGRLIALQENGPPYLIDLKSGKSELLNTQRLPGCRSLLRNKKGEIWGVAHSGMCPLFRYLPEQGTLNCFFVGQYLFNTHTFTDDGKIWLAGNDVLAKPVIIIYDPETGEQEQILTPENQKILAKGAEFNMLLETKDGRLLVASPVGLFSFDRASKKLTRHGDGADGNPRLSNQEINIIYEMPDGNLLIGTKDGLNIFNPKTGEVNIFTSADGLCNDIICGILPGESGGYWISTYYGIAYFDPSSGSFVNFYEKDGLTHNESNRFSYYKANDGMMYFGGMNGINAFYEKDLLPGVNNAPIFVSEVTFFTGQALETFRNWSLEKPIVISAENRYLAIRVGSFNMRDTKNNLFSYKIEGLDNDWVHMGTDHYIRFPLLPPGNYTLRIKAATPDGNWSTEQLAIPLIVKEFWYKSNTAYVFYVLLLGALAWLWVSFQKRRIKMQTELQHLLEVDNFKSRFFTNITHEFRTPLTVILGNLDIEKSEIGKFQRPDDSPRTSQFLNFLISKNHLTRRNAESLLRLINQLLDLAKLESNSLKMNYVQGDVLPYLRYVAESLHSLANTRNVMLKVLSDENRIVMDYDPERLLQIVHNLLSNAIKFTPSGGRVTLQVSKDLTGFENLSGLTLVVSDTGVGIPKEDLPKIFDRFYQAENQEHTKAGGTGIGLSLTKELVKAMGGDISVESNTSPLGDSGVGTTFTVRLPITQKAAEFTGVDLRFASAGPSSSPMQQQAPAASQDSSIANHSVLLIEDNPDVVEYLSSCLNGEYALDFAYNGRAGIEKALETVPDLIISDVMMPEKDGFEVCDFLKNDERTSHIPIVFLTAKADVESRIAGLRRGADAYLAKPFHQEELLVTLANLLELRRRLQAYYRQSAVGGRELEASALRTEAQNPKSEIEDVFLQKLRHVVEENLSDASLDVDAICRKIGMGRTNLHNKLSALTGLSITIYVRKLRLQRAKELLGSTQMNVSEVAYEVGFNDPKFFSRVFSEEFGVPPSDFKKH